MKYKYNFDVGGTWMYCQGDTTQSYTSTRQIPELLQGLIKCWWVFIRTIKTALSTSFLVTLSNSCWFMFNDMVLGHVFHTNINIQIRLDYVNKVALVKECIKECIYFFYWTVLQTTVWGFVVIFRLLCVIWKSKSPLNSKFLKWNIDKHFTSQISQWFKL